MMSRLLKLYCCVSTCVLAIPSPLDGAEAYSGQVRYSPQKALYAFARSLKPSDREHHGFCARILHSRAPIHGIVVHSWRAATETSFARASGSVSLGCSMRGWCRYRAM